MYQDPEVSCDRDLGRSDFNDASPIRTLTYTAMASSSLMDQYDTPLEFYLGNAKRFSEALPTMDEVKAATLAFCPFDPITGNLLAKESFSSLRVLTRILYLPYYPEILGLANTPLFVAKCLMEIDKYLEDHNVSVFRRPR